MLERELSLLLKRVFQESLSMATSSVLLSAPAIAASPKVLSKSSFLHDAKFFFTPTKSGMKPVFRRSHRFPTVVAKSYDHIPKQFREGNLADGLMDNFKNVPSSLYGLSPSQMEMFTREENPIRRQSQGVTEESISSAYYYRKGGMYSPSMFEGSPSLFASSVNMSRIGRGRRRRSPPDLPSYLLDGRIVYLGMPIVPAVCELIVAQFMWLDFDDPSKPIYLYINSTGIEDEDGDLVGSENDVFAIADMMFHVKADVYTVNLAAAYGPAAMLLALGKKGHRFVGPRTLTLLQLPYMPMSGGDTTDMWIQTQELDFNTDCTLDFLAKGIGKPKEVIYEDISGGLKYFGSKEAIEYGVADRELKPSDKAFEEYKRKGPRKPTLGPFKGGSGPRAASAGAY